MSSSVVLPRGLELVTIAQLAEHTLADADRTFCYVDDARITVGALWDGANRFANALLAHGVSPGDRVATILGNGTPIIEVMLASLRVGFIWVPVNFRLRELGLSHVLTDSDPAVIVLDPDLVDVSLMPATATILSVARDGAGSYADFVHGAPTEAPPIRAGLDDTVAISYTSGTTGPAKGVLLTTKMFLMCGAGVRHTLQAEAGDKLIVWEPMFHIGGNQLVIFALQTGVELHILTNFSASAFGDLLVERGITHLHYLGGILQILLRKGIDREQTRSLKAIWGGGCPPEQWEEAERVFGHRPREVFGLTETSSITTANLDGPTGSVGSALPGFEVAIAYDDGSIGAEPGRHGEIVVRAEVPGVLTKGYWRNEQATARLYPGDGWLHTGDGGYLDADGYLFFLGRMNDSVRHKGENISAWEVESVLNTHQEVEESAMVGVPGELGEYDLKVYIRPAQGSELDPAELVAWCAERMPSYQVPRYVSFVTEFPKTPTERIQKERLASLDLPVWDRLV